MYYNMTVKENGVYCKFFKRLLDDPKEIELNYHVSCNDSLMKLLKSKLPQ